MSWVLFGGFVGACASGVTAVLFVLPLSVGYLGGLFLMFFGVIGIGGGAVGGAVAGCYEAVVGPRIPRCKAGWKQRFLLAAPVLICLAWFLTAFMMWGSRPSSRQSVMRVRGNPAVAPVAPLDDGPSAVQIFFLPVTDGLKRLGKAGLQGLENFAPFALFYGLPVASLAYGALVGGRTVRALILWDELDEPVAGPHPFSPGVAAIEGAKPTRPDADL